MFINGSASRCFGGASPLRVFKHISFHLPSTMICCFCMVLVTYFISFNFCYRNSLSVNGTALDVSVDLPPDGVLYERVMRLAFLHLLQSYSPLDPASGQWLGIPIPLRLPSFSVLNSSYVHYLVPPLSQSIGCSLGTSQAIRLSMDWYSSVFDLPRCRNLLMYGAVISP